MSYAAVKLIQEPWMREWEMVGPVGTDFYAIAQPATGAVDGVIDELGNIQTVVDTNGVTEWRTTDSDLELARSIFSDPE